MGGEAGRCCLLSPPFLGLSLPPFHLHTGSICHRQPPAAAGHRIVGASSSMGRVRGGLHVCKHTGNAGRTRGHGQLSMDGRGSRLGCPLSPPLPCPALPCSLPSPPPSSPPQAHPGLARLVTELQGKLGDPPSRGCTLRAGHPVAATLSRPVQVCYAGGQLGCFAAIHRTEQGDVDSATGCGTRLQERGKKRACSCAAFGGPAAPRSPARAFARTCCRGVWAHCCCCWGPCGGGARV